MLYISFGLEKGGSTLTANLTKRILEAAGHPHIEFSATDRGQVSADGIAKGRGGSINNVKGWLPEIVQTLDQGVPSDRIVLFRTHREPSPEILSVIREGRARCHVALRDPRDIILSLFDTVARKLDRGRGNAAEIEIGNVSSTFQVVGRNIERALEWAEAPGAIILDYENTAFDPTVTISAICTQLGLVISHEQHARLFAEAASRKNGKFNVGRSRRHRLEMKAEDQQAVLDHFTSFYARFYPSARVDVDEH